MKIGVISDTHLARPSPELIQLVEDYFKEVDLILHAGDLVEKEVLEIFAGKEWKAVAGNMDSPQVRATLPFKQTIRMGKFKLGLIHGRGTPWGLEERVKKEFEKVDCIIYGHTHSPINHRKEGILFFNPGSPTDRIFAKENSVGIIEIGETIQGKIIIVNA